MNRSAQERLAVGLLKGWSNVYCIKLMPLHYFKGNQNLFKHKQEHLPISFRTKEAKKNTITSVHYYTTTTKNKIQQLKLWKHMFNSIINLLEPRKSQFDKVAHFKHDLITPMLSVNIHHCTRQFISEWSIQTTHIQIAEQTTVDANSSLWKQFHASNNLTRPHEAWLKIDYWITILLPN